MAAVLTSLFPDENATSTSARGPGFFFGRGRGNDASANQSERAKKQSKVLAVADPRTSSIIVSASKDLMEQITPMIAELDSNASKKQKVYVYHLKNTDPTEVQTVLQSLFETQNSRNGRTTQTSQQANALTQRQTTAARNQGVGTAGFGTGAGQGSGLGLGR
jgi:type II secretory pathway component GspD/PulD (secretin)